MNQKFLIICINYFNDQETVDFVNKLLLQEGDINLEIIVVDNSISINKNESIRKQIDRSNSVATYIPEKNLGYFGGAFWAYNRYLKEKSIPDWVIVCNTDIDIEDKNFFDKMALYNMMKNLGVIAPSIISTKTGLYQNPFLLKRPSILQMYSYNKFLEHYYTAVIYILIGIIKKKFKGFLNKLKSKLKSKKKIYSDVIDIYAPHGSFIIFNRRYFENGGTLQHGVFLFGEEIFVAETVCKIGLKVMYIPTLCIIHNEHSTTGVFKSYKMVKYAKEAAQYCCSLIESTEKTNC